MGRPRHDIPIGSTFGVVTLVAEIAPKGVNLYIDRLGRPYAGHRRRGRWQCVCGAITERDINPVRQRPPRACWHGPVASRPAGRSEAT